MDRKQVNMQQRASKRELHLRNVHLREEIDRAPGPRKYNGLPCHCTKEEDKHQAGNEELGGGNQGCHRKLEPVVENTPTLDDEHEPWCP